jgi:predicted amidohydrolase
LKSEFSCRFWAFLGFLSIAAPFVPVIAALMCTTKRSVEGVRILDLLGHQKLKYSRQNPFCGRVGGSDRRWSWKGGDAVVVVVVVLGKWAVLFCPLSHNQLGIFGAIARRDKQGKS